MFPSCFVSFMDFTARDLPTKKWMKLFRPKMRLRVRVQNRNPDFVSSTVKVGNQSASEINGAEVHWPWKDGSEPCLADDDVFEIEVERRFLLRYRCIRRTKPVTIDQVRTGDHCALSLYDGQHPVEMLDGGIEIGEIMFTLRSDVMSKDVSEGKASPSTFELTQTS